MTLTIEPSLTASGLVYVHPFDDPSAPMPEPEHFPILTLSGASVDVQMPDGWRVRSLNRSMLLHSQRRVIGWQTSLRGFALWSAVADLPDAVLVEVLEVNGAILAQYRLDQLPTSPRLTLWQGRPFELFTYNLTDISDAVDHVAGFKVAERDNGLAMDLSNWLISDEELTGPLATPSDDEGRFLTVSMKSLAAHPEDRPSWSGSAGRFGDFYLLGESVEDGILYASDSVLIEITPRGGHNVELRQGESALLQDLSGVWREAKFPQSVSTEIGQVEQRPAHFVE